MNQQRQIQTWQNIPQFDWHLGPVEATQPHFYTSQYLEPFPFFPFNPYEDYQQGPTDSYQPPPNTFSSTEHSLLDAPPLPYYENPYSISELPSDPSTSPFSELPSDPSTSSFSDRDRFIIEAHAAKIPWKSISKAYEDCFGASNASTPRALTTRLSRLKKKHPELRDIKRNIPPLDKEAKKSKVSKKWTSRKSIGEHAYTRLAENDENGGTEGGDTDLDNTWQNVSHEDALTSTHQLLTFLGQPGNEHLVSPDEYTVVVRIGSLLGSQVKLKQM